MYDLRTFVSELKNVSYFEIYDYSPETSARILELDKQGYTSLFRLTKYGLTCVSGVLNTREKLYRVLDANSDFEAYAKLLNACSNPSKPKVKDFKNFFNRVDDLDRVPFVKLFPKDGGLYTTASIIIACLDEQLCNASVHRVMKVDKRRAVARIVPRHLRKIYEEYRRQGKDTPIAIVIGAPPHVILAAASSPPFGVFELEVAASIRNTYISYTPIHDLPIPIPSAVVIEGRIKANEFVEEGPFVDILGLYDKKRLEPVIEVDAVYINEDELFHIVIPSSREHMLLQSFYREALIWDSVRKVVPRVCKVRLTPGSGSWLHAIVAIEKSSEGDGKLAILAAFAAHPSLKLVTVVDCDIDPDKLEEVEWAIATRVKPSIDIFIIPRARCSTLDPSSEDGLCDKIGIDATIPFGVDRERFVRVRVDVSNEMGREGA